MCIFRLSEIKASCRHSLLFSLSSTRINSKIELISDLFLLHNRYFTKQCFSYNKSFKRLSLVEQELLTLPGHLSSPTIFNGVRGALSLVFCVVFVLLSFFFLLTIVLSVFFFLNSNSNSRTLYRFFFTYAYQNIYL